MEPISILITMMLKNPQLLAQGANGITQPGEVDKVQIQSSLIDFARQTLKCYHHTGRFRDAEVLAAPWQSQGKYGATSSFIMKISYQGAFSGSPYEMTVAAMAKEGAYRTAVISEKAIVSYNAKCELESWTQVSTESK
jgi:hypothetical protein